MLAPLLVSFSQSINVSVDVKDVTCNGLENACATVSINGGTAPYEINWNLGGTGFESCGYNAGQHYVIVKDAVDAEAIVAFTVNEPEQFVAGVTNTGDASCAGCADGKLTLEFYGGTGPFIYILDELTFETQDRVIDLYELPAGLCSIMCYDNSKCASSAAVIVPNL